MRLHNKCKGNAVETNNCCVLFLEYSISGMLNGYVYETADEDAGEFRYFVLLPDTPATTYHIKFRYGSNLDALADYAAGPYAYWPAAGIPADSDDKMIENVIRLFDEENLAGAGQAEKSAEAGEMIEISTAEELQVFAKSVPDGSKDGCKGTTVLLISDRLHRDRMGTPSAVSA